MNVANEVELSALAGRESVAELRARCAQLEAEKRLLEEDNALLQERVNRLWESESRLRRLIEANIIGVVIFDVDGRVVQANPAFLHMIGRTPRDLDVIGVNWSELVPESKQVVWQRARAQLIETAMTLGWETELCKLNGEIAHVLMGATLLLLPGETGLCQLRNWGLPNATESETEPGYPAVMAFALDLSAQKRAEAELRASEERMRTVVESLHEGLLITDLDDVVLYCNRRMEELSGYSIEEMLGKPAYQLFLSPESWGTVQGHNRRRAQGESAQYELLERRKNGESWWSLVNGSPLRDGEGNVIGTIGAQSDITERKLAEERARRFAIRLEESNRDLQSFAYAVSHDLKEPLRKVQVFGDRIEKRAGATLDEESLDYLRRMRSAAGRMGGLIDGLLELSRVMTRGRGFAPVDMNAVAREALSDLQIAHEAAGGEVRIGPLPTVQADRVQMRQLLQNLLANSIRYRRLDVPLSVKVEGWVNTEESGIRICDNGIGFDALESERIFDVFVRLAPRENDGVGVGLTICRKIVERHGGTIEAQGVPDAGAVFTIRLPRESANGAENLCARQ